VEERTLNFGRHQPIVAARLRDRLRDISRIC
jgi:hypothetical protein